MKIRLDQYLCQNGLAQSRERAKALIMAGIVYVGEEKSDKPGNMVDENAHVEVRGHDIRYVSRGGLKLEKAMQVFPLTPEGKVCMDIGASTGGFTDCMLQNGAVKVYAVDVGYGTACMDAALRQTCCEYGTHQHPPCDSGTATGAGRFFQRGCFLYFSQAYLSGRCRHHRAGGGRCLPCKAAV